MKRPVFGFVVVAALAVLTWGCAPADSTSDDDSVSSNEQETAGDDGQTLLCGTCGQEKGSDSCCDESAEKCACGMHKDSPLCCVEIGDDAAGKDLCKACGHVAEEGHECDEDCEKCADCGLHKGSPLCCKIKS